MCDIRIYDNEQQELKDLIETNIRQRGDISSSSLKMGRIIKTLEECYGIQHGGNKSKSANGTLGQKDNRIGDPTMLGDKSQKDIAEELGMNQYVNEEVDGNYFRQANLASEIGLDERQLRN